MKTRSPVLDALNARAWHEISSSDPRLLDAIEEEVAGGTDPQDIYHKVVEHSGPFDGGLAKKVLRAALYAASQQRAG